MRESQVDELLRDVVGPIGFWQVAVMLLMTLSSSNTVLQPDFLSAIPKHRCKLDNQTETNILQSPNEASALVKLIENSCYLPEIPPNTASTIQALTEAYQIAANNTVACEYGHVYEFMDYQYTNGLVAEWDLVCDRAWLLPFSESVFLAGMALGFPASGWFSDRYGRRPVFICSLICEFIFCLAASLSPIVEVYITVRFFVAVSFSSRICTTNVLLAETTTGKYRNYIVGLSVMIVYGLQSILMATIAYFVSTWRLLTQLLLIPYSLGIVTFVFLPESPKWLAVQDKFDNLVTVLYCAYRWNHTCCLKRNKLLSNEEFVDKITEGVQKSTYNPVASPQPKELCDFGGIKVISLCMILFAGHITNLFGISLYASNIHLNTTFVVMLNGTAATLGVSIAILLLHYLKRRKYPLLGTLVTTEILLFVICMYTLIAEPNNDIFLITTSNIVLVTIFAAHSIIYVYLPELFQLEVRNLSFGLIAGVTRVLTLLVPFINELDTDVKHGLPLVFYTCIIIIQLIALSYLPNTDGETGEEVVEEEYESLKEN